MPEIWSIWVCQPHSCLEESVFWRTESELQDLGTFRIASSWFLRRRDELWGLLIFEELPRGCEKLKWFWGWDKGSQMLWRNQVMSRKKITKGRFPRAMLADTGWGGKTSTDRFPKSGVCKGKVKGQGQQEPKAPRGPWTWEKKQRLKIKYDTTSMRGKSVNQQC